MSGQKNIDTFVPEYVLCGCYDEFANGRVVFKQCRLGVIKTVDNGGFDDTLVQGYKCSTCSLSVKKADVLRFIKNNAYIFEEKVLHEKTSLQLLRDVLLVDSAGAQELMDLDQEKDNELWKKKRLFRITGSILGEVLSYKISNPNPTRSCVAKCASKLLYPENLDDNVAIRHGKVTEPIARSHYIRWARKMYLQVGRKRYGDRLTQVRVKVTPKGLAVRPETPYIGASPDGLVEVFGRVDGKWQRTPFYRGLVELKCPVYVRDQRTNPNYIMSASKKYGTHAHSGLHITDKYYKQVQCQMYSMQVDTCDFAVFYKDKQGNDVLEVQWVEFDSPYWSAVMAKAQALYFPYLQRYFQDSMVALYSQFTRLLPKEKQAPDLTIDDVGRFSFVCVSNGVDRAERPEVYRRCVVDNDDN